MEHKVGEWYSMGLCRLPYICICFTHFILLLHLSYLMWISRPLGLKQQLTSMQSCIPQILVIFWVLVRAFSMGTRNFLVSRAVVNFFEFKVIFLKNFCQVRDSNRRLFMHWRSAPRPLAHHGLQYTSVYYIS